MKGLAKIVSSLILSVSLSSCLPSTLAIYEDVKPVKPVIKDDYDDFLPSKKAIGIYLYRINHSKFLKDKQEIKDEIADNKYGILKKEINTDKGEVLGYYYLLGEKILLHENLFVRKGKGDGVTYYLPPVRNPLPILIHELFHDFWFNDLISYGYKKEFSNKVKKFYEEIVTCKSLEDKIKFLKKTGYINPQEKDFKFFEKIIKRKEGYSESDFFGNELYSIIAELTLAKRIIIPKQLRKYYEPLVSEEWLNKDKLK